MVLWNLNNQIFSLKSCYHLSSSTNCLPVLVLHWKLEQRWRERPSGTTARASSWCSGAGWSTSPAIFAWWTAQPCQISTKPAWKFSRARSWVEQLPIYAKTTSETPRWHFKAPFKAPSEYLMSFQIWKTECGNTCVFIFQRMHTEWCNFI